MPDLDLLNPKVHRVLRARILDGEVRYMHFGLPCKTWGPLARINGSSRTRSCPAGTAPRPKDLLANREARLVASLCRDLSSVGAFWSIENPRTSYCFLYEPIRALNDLSGVLDVHFDQCMYGLLAPTSGPSTPQHGAKSDPGIATHGFALIDDWHGAPRFKKPTTIRTNIPRADALARKCDRSHPHTHALGSIRIGSDRVSLASAAGAYPAPLCQSLADLLAQAAPALRRP